MRYSLHRGTQGRSLPGARQHDAIALEQDPSSARHCRQRAATASVSSLHVACDEQTQCSCCCVVLTMRGALLHESGATE